MNDLTPSLSIFLHLFNWNRVDWLKPSSSYISSQDPPWDWCHCRLLKKHQPVVTPLQLFPSACGKNAADECVSICCTVVLIEIKPSSRLWFEWNIHNMKCPSLFQELSLFIPMSYKHQIWAEGGGKDFMTQALVFVDFRWPVAFTMCLGFSLK